MQVIGDESVVRGNVVRDTGPSGIGASAMVMAGSIDIIDNTVSGVIGTGIAVLINTAGRVSGNHVRDVATRGIDLFETGPVFANLIVGFDRAVVGCNAFDNTNASGRELDAP